MRLSVLLTTAWSSTPTASPEEKGGQSSQRLWLFIQWLIEQEALAMSSEEDEAVCLTNNNNLELYTHRIP